ncbi:MAG: phage portal protein [Chloroflexota bacterium]
MAGGYEGAAGGRRLGDWGTSSSGPNQILFSSLGALRARSRELSRNDPQIDGALDTLVSNIVGTGISPRWQIEDSEIKKRIQAAWAAWVYEADASGLLDFYGLQSLVCREVIEAGEVLVRFRPRRPEDGLTVPLQLQVLEGDHLDAGYNAIAPNGNEIRMGIEFDRIGRRTAYWLFREHPGENQGGAFGASDRVRVPAGEVLHIFKPLRAGQQRGRPWLASVILTMHELTQFNDAELVRKKTAAMFSGFLKQPTEEMGPPNVFGAVDGEDPQKPSGTTIYMEPGTFSTLPPGYEVVLAQPADVGGNYETFVKHQERRAARGIGGLTYEKFTGDLSDVNYSSIRAGNLEFQRQCKQFIFQVLVFQLCRPVAQTWLTQAYLAGAIDLPGFGQDPKQYQRIKWTIDGWPWVDPEKDLNASKGLVRAGFSSRTQEVAERGLDIEELEAEIAADNERADRFGLVFDSDTRKTDLSGRNYSSEGQ